MIGMLDPNQLICGKGVQYLRRHGLEVDLFPSGFMASVEDQNREFTRDQERLAGAVLEAGKKNLTIDINPRFQDDLERLDRTFKLDSIADRHTVFIIAGETIVAELLDRYSCGILRAEIDRRSEGHPFKRGLIVSAKTWKDRRDFTERSPAISIGSERANEISAEWLELAKQKGIKPFPLGSGSGIYISEPRPRAVLGGALAVDTKAAVERYISEPRGLREFLANAWR